MLEDLKNHFLSILAGQHPRRREGLQLGGEFPGCRRRLRPHGRSLLRQNVFPSQQSHALLARAEIRRGQPHLAPDGTPHRELGPTQRTPERDRGKTAEGVPANVLPSATGLWCFLF